MLIVLTYMPKHALRFHVVFEAFSHMRLSGILRDQNGETLNHILAWAILRALFSMRDLWTSEFTSFHTGLVTMTLAVALHLFKSLPERICPPTRPEGSITMKMR